jgi:hypothetical protein
LERELLYFRNYTSEFSVGEIAHDQGTHRESLMPRNK